MEHFKDYIRPINGGVSAAEHAALRDITRPITDHYRGEAWTTALAIVRGRRDAAREKYEHSTVLRNTSETSAYLMGRYEMARDILAEMEERGKP